MCDRVVLDAGGRKFVSSKSTLCAGSTYFASKFSRNWDHHTASSHGNVVQHSASSQQQDQQQQQQPPEECFIDQNPDAFAVLLEFLRDHLIDIRQLDARVILLAEFLGMELLLSAIKVRAYCNIHLEFNVVVPSTCSSMDHTNTSNNSNNNNNEDAGQQQAIAAFDAEFPGGMREAIVKGYLPRYLTERRNAAAFREYATLAFPPCDARIDVVDITAKETEGLPNESRKDLTFLQALNWLHYHGYTNLSKDMEWDVPYGDEYAFYREKQPSHRFLPRHSSFTDVLIDNTSCDSMDVDHDAVDEPQKSFAMLITDHDGRPVIFYGVGSETEVPLQEGRDVPNHRNCRWGVGKLISYGALASIRKRGFYHRETELENTFTVCLDRIIENTYFPDARHRQFQIYSKRLDVHHNCHHNNQHHMHNNNM